MKLTKFKILLILLANSFLFLFSGSDPALACGPYITQYIYTPKDIDIYYPLMENENLFNGSYGLILSNWGPEYFYPIYMELNGREISPEVKKELLSYYEDNYYYVHKRESGVDAWEEARKLVTESEVEIKSYKTYKDSHSYFTNCSSEAFFTAKETLEARAKIYSKEQLKLWLEQQDEVFSNCGGAFDKKIILTGKQGFLTKISYLFSDIKNFFSKIARKSKTKRELSPEELFEYDKEYQQAAVDFYQDNFEAAEKKFKKIADNYDHPWREYAALVIGRIYIRKVQLGTVEKYGNSKNPEDIKKAEEIRKREFEKANKQFERILKDDSLSFVHKGAKDLRNYILFRIDPQARLKVANDALLSSDIPKEIINNIEDFSLLWYRKLTRKVIKEDEEIDDKYREFEKFILKNGDDFSQWLYAWWNPEKNNLDLALEKYKKTKSPAWLLASLKLMTPNHSSKDQIIQDAEKIPKDSPAYLTANYYRLKLLIASGQKEKAKEELSSLLNEVDFDKTPIAKNYFMDLGMLNSKNLEEALGYSSRSIVTKYWDYFLPYFRKYEPLESTEHHPLMDIKMKKSLNMIVPLAKWVDVVVGKNELSSEIKVRMGVTAFIRAVLLDNWELAREIVRFLTSSDLRLKNDFSDFMNAKTQKDEKFATALLILKYPSFDHFLGVRFDQALIGDYIFRTRDIFRRNWWCKDESRARIYFESGKEQDDVEALRQFLSDDEMKQAQSENEIIYNNVAPNFLAEIVIDYAIDHPQDSRVPQALHSIVDATRYAQCKDKKTTEFSKKAFQLLHNNYPGSYWAKETPYWY